MKLAYSATDTAGQVVQGTISARDADDAADRLFARGLTPLTITRASRDGGSKQAPGARGSRSADAEIGAKASRATPAQLASFARQLALLTDTGTPLLQALQSLVRQLPAGVWRSTIERVCTAVEEGRSLAEAMSAQGQTFPPVYRSLIAAGEAGGRLTSMLKRLAEMTQRQVRTRNLIRGAMMYPVLLIFIAIAVVSVMLTVVLPRFAEMFETLDAPMPPSTAVMMAVSEFLRTRWYVVAGVIAAGAAAAWVAFRSERVRAMLEHALISAPILGPVLRSVAAARVARVLGVLLDCRVPMLEALELTSHAAGLASYRALLARSRDAVTLGETMGPIFQASTLLPASMGEAVQTGEQTGRLGPVLVNLADYLDEENEAAVKSLTSLLEPLILLLLGLVVGGMSISMFLPLFDLTASAAGG